MKKWFIGLVVIAIIAGLAGYYFYNSIFGPNVDLKNETELSYLVPTGSTLESLKADLQSKKILINVTAFDQVAQLMKFQNPKPGHYILKNNWSTKDLITTLRSGRQTALNLTFNNYRTVDQLYGFFGSKLESDSISIANYFQSQEVLDKYNCTSESLMTLVIPNTYQFYWNTSPQKLLSRLVTERDKYFDESKMEKAKELGLTKSEVYILASIVQKETLVNSEKPRVAGVYLNRLKRGQLLQADPTVVFANGDFELRRVLNRHLEIDIYLLSMRY